MKHRGAMSRQEDLIPEMLCIQIFDQTSHTFKDSLTSDTFGGNVRSDVREIKESV